MRTALLVFVQIVCFLHLSANGASSSVAPVAQRITFVCSKDVSNKHEVISSHVHFNAISSLVSENEIIEFDVEEEEEEYQKRNGSDDLSTVYSFSFNRFDAYFNNKQSRAFCNRMAFIAINKLHVQFEVFLI